MRRGGSHEWDMLCRREDMLAHWGPPCAAVEKIDREEGNLRSTVNSTSNIAHKHPVSHAEDCSWAVAILQKVSFI